METPYTDEELNQQVFEQAKNFARWQYESIAPYLGGDVAEIGPGNGRITRFLWRDRRVKSITGFDTNRRYLKKLSTTFAGGKKPAAFSSFDLSAGKVPRPLREAFDTVLLIDVLEHVRDDVTLIRNAAALLRPGGCAVALVSAIKMLYGEPDRAQNHYRRFSREEIRLKLANAGLDVERIFPMNVLGTFAWLYHSRILKLRVHNAGDMRLFDRLVPVLRLFEAVVPIPFGLSYIAVGRKRGFHAPEP